ncbi:hypothetical protein B0H63DRAFT_543375 [Podospora didyma]|uniref:Uncharacterized protein n=1 Tax=Podospora didyma TaxID=330526 RepID=A0AAE0TZG9_9PEZI|nr:hypothetical protein B0H63DRAFT_543375 [Podospora didyma]
MENWLSAFTNLNYKKQMVMGLVILVAFLAMPWMTAAAHCNGQTLITGLTACDNMKAALERCGKVRASSQDFAACYCTQEMFTTFISCKNEIRRCFLTDTFDASLDAALADWHSFCDDSTPSAVTTPAQAPLSTTLKLDGCLSAAQACVQRQSGIASCESIYSTDAADVTSCRCHPSQVDLASRCEMSLDRCVPTAVAVADVWEYRNCRPALWPTPAAMVTFSASSRIAQAMPMVVSPFTEPSVTSKSPTSLLPVDPSPPTATFLNIFE